AAVHALRNALELNGFDKWETETQVIPQLPLDLGGTLFDPVISQPVAAQPRIHPKAIGWTMPLFAIDVEGEPEPLECSDYLPASWDIADYDFRLSEAEYPDNPV